MLVVWLKRVHDVFMYRTGFSLPPGVIGYSKHGVGGMSKRADTNNIE